jgi:hypothetical protein
MNREEIIPAAIASPNSNPIVESCEDILLTRCLNDKNGDAIERYGDVLTKLVSPTKRTIGAAILTRYYDGQSTNFVAVEQYLHGRGELKEVGETTLTKLGAGVVFDDMACDGARDAVLDAWKEIEEARVLKDWTAGKITTAQVPDKLHEILSQRNTTEREPRIRFYTPCLLRDFVPDKDIVLVGDCHIMRGEVFVIGGEPGVGKSLTATQLAVSGATQRDWLGLTVRRQFRTMIVQTENGRYRLQAEFSALDCDEIENWIRVSEPPPFGITLTNKEFLADIGAALDSFKPECVILDPWNAAARDDKQRDYVETFDALRNLLPTGSDKPALGIVAHTRKPQPNDKRTGGTGLMHQLSGSYIVTSVPRCIFVMIRGSQDETEDSVVFFNPKNSNGANAPRSAWHRKLSGFTPATDFDWKDFDKPPEERKIIRLDHLREVFDDGKKRLERKDAAHDLATLAKVTESAAYNALKEDGKFSANLSHSNGMLIFHSTKFPRESR